MSDFQRLLVVVFAMGAVTLGTLGLAAWGDPLREMAGGVMCAGIAVILQHV